jgi:hypothetical protein
MRMRLLWVIRAAMYECACVCVCGEKRKKTFEYFMSGNNSTRTSTSPMTIVNFSFYVLCTCVAVNSIRNHFVTSRLPDFNFHSFRRRKQSHRGKCFSRRLVLVDWREMERESKDEREKERVSLHFIPTTGFPFTSLTSPPLFLSLDSLAISLSSARSFVYLFCWHSL